jgi:hypothetical protein
MPMSAGGKVRTHHSHLYHADSLRSGGKVRICSGRLLSRTGRYRRLRTSTPEKHAMVIENTSWATRIAPAQPLFPAEAPLSASSYSIHSPKNFFTCFLGEPIVYSPAGTRGFPSFAVGPSAVPVAPHRCYTHFRVSEELYVERASSSVDRSYSQSAVHVIGSSFRVLTAFGAAINTAFGEAILVIWSQLVTVADGGKR